MTIANVPKIINGVLDITQEGGSVDPIELPKRELIIGRGGGAWSEFLEDGREIIHKPEPFETMSPFSKR